MNRTSSRLLLVSERNLMGKLKNRKEVRVCVPDNGYTFCAAPGAQVALWARVLTTRLHLVYYRATKGDVEKSGHGGGGSR